MKTNQKNSILALVLAGVMAVMPVSAAGEPDNVQNVVVTSKNPTTLQVSWDQAMDVQNNPADHYRLYYGPDSVQTAQAAQYEVIVDTPTEDNSYDLTNLTTGVTYYVSVTAFDANGTESVEYSVEASGTPGATLNAAANEEENAAAEAGTTQTTSTEADDEAPTVLNAIAADKNHLLVGFSEKVMLPTNNPESAFEITEQANEDNTLVVSGAEVYADDPDQKTILVTTADQTENTSYVITVSSNVTDEAGNPIKSADGDSALWFGSGETESTVAQAQTDQAAEDLLNETPNTEDPNGTEEESEEETDQETEEQTGEEEAEEEDPVEEPDTTAPEDATDLVLEFTEEEMENRFKVLMNWKAGPNSKGDLANQLVYMSTDGGETYDSPTTLNNVVTSHEVGNLEGGQTYNFKLTAKDENGNESEGITGIVTLPQTGAGVGAILFGSAFGANRMLKRRRKKLVEKM